MDATAPAQETLFWTAAGHLPESALRLEARWSETADYVRVDLCYFRGTELVKNDVHVMTRKPLLDMGAAAGQIGG